MSLMARQLSKRKEWSMELENTLLIISILVESDEERVVDNSLECVLELSFKRALIRPMARLNDLIEAIARAVLNEFNTFKCQEHGDSGIVESQSRRI